MTSTSVGSKTTVSNEQPHAVVDHQATPSDLRAILVARFPQLATPLTQEQKEKLKLRPMPPDQKQALQARIDEWRKKRQEAASDSSTGSAQDPSKKA